VAPTRLRLPLALSFVAAALAAAPAQATFPGRNGAIAYTGTGSSGGPGTIFDTRGLYAHLPGQSDPRALIQCRLTDYVPSGGNCTGTIYGDASYSADGRRIVLDTGDRLAVIGADGSEFLLLPATTSNDGDPAFAPDGKRIVYTGINDRGTTDVYIRRLDGGPARVLVYDASAPAWSSRNRIAYVREGNVYSVDPNGRRRRFVTSGLTPDWSPDGRQLLIVRPPPNLVYAANTGRIYVVSAGGRGLRQIGKNKYLSNPVWSPDGRSLAFDGFEYGVHRRAATTHARIREIAPTQSGSEGAFVSSYSPAWQPR
jgi:TolB protein